MDTNEFFREATLRICGSLEIQKALQDTLFYLRRFMPVQGISVNIYRNDTREVETVADVTEEGTRALAVRTPVPHDLQVAIEEHIHYRERQLLGNWSLYRTEEDGITKRFCENLGWPPGWCLELGLILEGKEVGVVVVNSPSPDIRYSREHVDLLTILNEPFAVALSNCLRHRELQAIMNRLDDDNRYLRAELRRMTGEEIVGADFGLREVMEMVRRVAPLDSPVLLLGETGTGKEVIANAIHNASPRSRGPFVKVNCGALPESLVDSELFGHEKGAFTGAISRKRGRFERAHGGTIFLDEVGELPPDAQVRLLRVLQEKVIERVGGSAPIPVDIRIIAATNRDLDAMRRTQAFREDLFFRLSVFPIMLPPLRHRTMDIPSLVQHFLRRKANDMGLATPPTPTARDLEQLMSYHWPGNVRELENAVERALILGRGRTLDVAPLVVINQGRSTEPVLSRAPAALRPDTIRLDDVIREHIESTLCRTSGRVHGPGGAAELLGVNPATLRHRMRKLGVAFGRDARELYTADHE